MVLIVFLFSTGKPRIEGTIWLAHMMTVVPQQFMIMMIVQLFMIIIFQQLLQIIEGHPYMIMIAPMTIPLPWTHNIMHAGNKKQSL
jgi:hypothetical protein